MPRGRPKLPRDEQGNIIRQKPDSVSAPTATIVEQAKDFDKTVADAKQDSDTLIVAKTNYGFHDPIPKEVIDTVLDKPFKFHLDLCGQIFEGTGATAFDALKAIPTPEKITTKGTLVITHGEKAKTLILLIPTIKRLFYHNFQEVIIKQLVYGL